MRLTAILLVGLLASACAGDSVTVADAPTTLGPVAREFAPPNGLPTHGPRNELTVWLPAGYHVEHDSLGHAVLYDLDRHPVTFQVALSFANGEQRAFRGMGYLSGKQGFGVQFTETVPANAPATAWALSIAADPPVNAQRIELWTGDPRKRCVFCL